MTEARAPSLCASVVLAALYMLAAVADEPREQTGTNRAADLLVGRRGNDELRGKGGDDELRGGRGNDLLRGGAGDDVLHGGDGKDRFAFALGNSDHKIIADFEAGDTIALGADPEGGSWPAVADILAGTPPPPPPAQTAPSTLAGAAGAADGSPSSSATRPRTPRRRIPPRWAGRSRRTTARRRWRRRTMRAFVGVIGAFGAEKAVAPRRRTPPAAGESGDRIQGAFYGPGHTETAGIFERSNIVGAFGARAQ